MRLDYSIQDSVPMVVGEDATLLVRDNDAGQLQFALYLLT